MSENDKNGGASLDQKDALPDIDLTTNSVDPKSAEAIASLEKKLAREIDVRREERFIWIITTMILLDIIWLSPIQNLSLSLVIFALQATILTVIGNRLGIEKAPELITKWSDRFMSNEKGQ